jgi:hypothetical protein
MGEPLNVKQLEGFSTDELRKAAAECFTSSNHGLSDAQNVEQLLRAQVYLSETAHRDDAGVTRRDLIVLIAAEIIIALVEGHSQTRALEALATSADQSVTAMQDVSTNLNTLNTKQDQLLKAQAIANTELQGTVEQTTSMAAALKNQLKIIKQEEDERLATAAKKPSLILSVNGAASTATDSVES